jgi:hypothetical protein
LIFSLHPAEEDGIIELYDLVTDPREGKNLLDDSLLSIEPGRRRLREFLDAAAVLRGAAPALPVELSPEQLDKLRALGYAR